MSGCQDCSILVDDCSRTYTLSASNTKEICMVDVPQSQLKGHNSNAQGWKIPKHIPCWIAILTTAGPTLAAAFAIVSLPKQSLGLDLSSTAPEDSLDTSDEGTGLTLYEYSASIPTRLQLYM